jgi:hypothetical protein
MAVDLNAEHFWDNYYEVMDKPASEDKDFNILFKGMVCKNPKDRFSIEKIKNSSWYQKEVYNQVSLETVMRSIVNNQQNYS